MCQNNTKFQRKTNEIEIKRHSKVVFISYVGTITFADYCR